MPKADGWRKPGQPGQPQRIKRYFSLVAITLALAATLDQWGFRASSFGARLALQSNSSPPQEPPRSPTEDTSLSQGPTGADCTFLKNPQAFREANAVHRTAVSTTTEWVALQLPQGQMGLSQAQDFPRKNFIDTILFGRMERDGIQSAPLCSDAEFIRRVTLDLAGRIPSAEDVTKFLADTNPAKRDVLVDALLGTPEYVDKWTMFFGDLFKNTARSTNVVRYQGGRDAFYKYIKDAIAKNKSYAQMATEMIAATGDSYVDGQTNYIVGGTVPMGPPQDTMDGLAVNTSTMFLGVAAMDCLLCHNGAGHLDSVNLWGSQRLRSEAWGMSAFFARTRMQRQNISQQPPTFKFIVSENNAGEYLLNTTTGNRSARRPLPNGSTTATPSYIFGVGGLNPGENRRQAIARLVTADPQFARAAVNYLWEKLMVEALVSPSNGFDPARLDASAPPPSPWTLQAANAELLNALAQDFIQSGYNLQKLLGLIAKSSAYQLSTKYPGTWKIQYVPYYARKYVRRLDAEEIHDAVAKATGILGSYTIGTLGTINWAMQLPDTVEPLVGRDTAVRVFLNAFQRGDRDQKLRTLDPAILQALSLMNSSFVMTRIHQSNAGSTVSMLLAQSNLTPTQVITSLYLATLSRNPTPEELQTLTPYFLSLGRQSATESIQWVLLNKVDFIFNY